MKKKGMKTRRRKMKNLKSNWVNWLKFSILLFIIILITVGFGFGYIYADTTCEEDPLKYSVQKLNEVNNDNFTCSCTALSGKIKPFYFDETGPLSSPVLNREFFP